MDVRFARIEALLWNIAQDPQLPPKTYQDFLPDFLGTQPVVESSADMEAQMESYGDAIGMTVLPPDTTDAEIEQWIVAQMQAAGQSIDDGDDGPLTFEEG